SNRSVVVADSLKQRRISQLPRKWFASMCCKKTYNRNAVLRAKLDPPKRARYLLFKSGVSDTMILCGLRYAASTSSEAIADGSCPRKDSRSPINRYKARHFAFRAL